MIKVMILIRRSPEHSMEEFRSWWHGPHAANSLQLPGLRRYVINERIDSALGNEAGEKWDGAAELWFDDLAAAEAAYASPIATAGKSDVAAHVATALRLVVREHEKPLAS